MTELSMCWIYVTHVIGIHYVQQLPNIQHLKPFQSINCSPISET